MIRAEPLTEAEKSNSAVDLYTKNLGASKQYVSGLLKLPGGPQIVVAMVKSGYIPVELAINVFQTDKSYQAAIDDAMIEVETTADIIKKIQATAKHIERKAPDLTRHPAYAAGLRRAVEIVRSAGHDDIAAEIEAVTPQ